MRWPLSFALLGLFDLSACAKFSARSNGPVCPSATVNYITQTLPQQCLRTDWTRPGSNGTQDAGNITLAQELGKSGATIDLPSSTATPSNEVSSTGNAELSTTLEIPTDQASSQATASPTTDDEDGDPLADHGNFLSFEEWKAQMLEKAGQSPDHIVGVTGVGADGKADTRHRPAGINNALESLGDEGEIELDFSGFANSETTPRAPPEVPIPDQNQNQEGEGDAPVPAVKRSKEAGTTSKERFNYASFDCAATVLKTNQGSKGATWILSENKDSYLINKCSETNKHIIVELCNDILIDTVVLGNFEFFSSTFRTFRVSISDRYPIKADKWREIGVFEARNARGVQAFLIEDGLIWARYLKVELLTHYGKEYYCPISLLRVHGTTMMDDYRNEMKDPQEQDDDDTEEGLTTNEEEVLPLEVISILPVKEDSKPVEVLITEVPTSTVTVTYDLTGYTTQRKGPLDSTSESLLVCPPKEDITVSSRISDPTITPIASTPSLEKREIIPVVTSAPSVASPGPKPSDSASITNATMAVRMTQMVVDNVTSSTANASVLDRALLTNSSIEATLTTSGTESSFSSAGGQNVSTETNPSITTAIPSIQPSESTAIKVDVKAQNKTQGTAKPKSKIASPIRAALATPSSQDSFFKTVHKRLQMLEANSTLSLLYIEEQSRILRDAFSKAEKKQMQRTSTFLETLNSTVLGELRNFRIQYDQIWQSTVLELASQRDQNQQEVHVLGERLGLVADKMVWLERTVYLQFILIVLCLGLVLFNKNGIVAGSSAPLELSLLQSIQHLKRANSSFSFSKRYSDTLESPPGTPSRPNTTGSMFSRKPSHHRNPSDGLTSGDDLGTNPTSSPERIRNKMLHARMDSTGTTSFTSREGSRAPSVHFEPVTPTSENEGTVNGTNDGTVGEELEVDPAALKRAASSPPLGRQFDPPSEDGLPSDMTDSDTLDAMD